MKATYDPVRSAEVIQVIVTQACYGKGTRQDPVRIVTQYWDLDGKLLAGKDPCRCETCGTLHCTSDHK